MAHHEFSPPPTEVTLGSIGTYPDGRVGSLSALVRDSAGGEFSLSLATRAWIASSAVEDPGDAVSHLDEDSEPVYVVPGTEIEPSEVDTIISGLSPEILSQYLVEQETD